MFLRGPVGDDLDLGGVDDGDLGLVPEADVELAGGLVEGEPIRERVGAEVDLGLETPRAVELREGVAEGVGDPERLAILRDRQAGGDPLLLGSFRRIVDLESVREQAARVVEPIDDVVPAAADEQPLAVGGPGEPLETFLDRDPADDLAGRGFQGDDLMLAISRVQDGQDRLGRVLGDGDREVPELRLSTGRFQRPTVRQDDRPRLRQARPGDLRLRLRGRFLGESGPAGQPQKDRPTDQPAPLDPDHQRRASVKNHRRSVACEPE